MKTIFILCLVSLGYTALGQPSITTIEFVQVVDNNEKEATYYYQNNWKVFREMALAKGYIESFKLLHVPKEANMPYDIILMTTFTNEEQFAQREEHFTSLIEEAGELKLLNELKPPAFRKSVGVIEKATQITE